MKIIFRTLVFLILFGTSAYAQNVPITQMQDGGQIQSTDQLHVSRCNHAGCDYRVHLSPVGASSSPLSTTNGGTGLTSVGGPGTVLTSDGSSLSWVTNNIIGSGLAFQCFRMNATGTATVWGNCLGSPVTSSPSGAGIVTQAAFNLVTQSGLNIIPHP